MSEEKESNIKANEKHSRKFKYLRYFIYSSYILSVLLLISVLTAIVSNRKTQPFYGWIEGTRVESYGNFVAGLIIEQKVSMQVDATNDPLSEEEAKDFEKIVEKHSLDLSKIELTPRDKRLLLEYPNHTPIIKGKYLILSDAHSQETQRFAPVLDKLFVSFVTEMNDCGLSDSVESRPHICFFKNRAAYMNATRKQSKGFHDSLGYFSPVKNCIYFFSRKSSIEGLEAMSKFDNHRQKSKENYSGNQLDDYLAVISREEQKYLKKLDAETLCTLRHEGTHQLAHIYGLHSTRGFEKRWLTEGLAQYFETEIPGEARNQKKTMLVTYMHEGKLFDWATLINSDEDTFLSNGNKHRQLAYSQSWLLVRYLMKNYKKEFFSFIRYKKNTGVLDDPVNDFERLCKELSISGEDLKIELQNELLSLK